VRVLRILFGLVVVAATAATAIMVLVDYRTRNEAITNARWCGLIKSQFFPDLCAGPCSPGQQCLPTATRPYFGFWKQASACGCPNLSDAAPAS
jgi:hypothetical protein